MRLPKRLATTGFMCVLWSITILSQSTGGPISDRATQLHARAVVIDGHADTTQRLVFERPVRRIRQAPCAATRQNPLNGTH